MDSGAPNVTFARAAARTPPAAPYTDYKAQNLYYLSPGPESPAIMIAPRVGVSGHPSHRCTPRPIRSTAEAAASRTIVAKPPCSGPWAGPTLSTLVSESRATVARSGGHRRRRSESSAQEGPTGPGPVRIRAGLGHAQHAAAGGPGGP